MKFVIRHNVCIEELQETFSKAYPFLKLEFFSEKTGEDTTGRKKIIVSGDTPLHRLMKAEQEGDIQFDNQTVVAELEKEFLEKFGLKAQVYRRAGNIWIETSITDMWTLEHQNEQGKLLSIQNGLDKK